MIHFNFVHPLTLPTITGYILLHRPVGFNF
jgi:hypothetical protein